MAAEAPVVEEEAERPEVVVEEPKLDTVAAVLSFPREKIAALTGLPGDSIKLDLKMGV